LGIYLKITPLDTVACPGQGRPGLIAGSSALTLPGALTVRWISVTRRTAKAGAVARQAQPGRGEAG